MMSGGVLWEGMYVIDCELGLWIGARRGWNEIQANLPNHCPWEDDSPGNCEKMPFCYEDTQTTSLTLCLMDLYGLQWEGFHPDHACLGVYGVREMFPLRYLKRRLLLPHYYLSD